MNRNSDWERLVLLMEKYSPQIDEEFAYHPTKMDIRDLPGKKWLAEEAYPRTCFRRYYEGYTYCILKDTLGKFFVGVSVCSDSESSYDRRFGRFVAKKRALEAMDKAYSTTYKGERCNISEFSQKVLRDMVSPEDLPDIKVEIPNGDVVLGFATLETVAAHNNRKGLIQKQED